MGLLRRAIDSKPNRAWFAELLAIGLTETGGDVKLSLAGAERVYATMPEPPDGPVDLALESAAPEPTLTPEEGNQVAEGLRRQFSAEWDDLQRAYRRAERSEAVHLGLEDLDDYYDRRQRTLLEEIKRQTARIHGKSPVTLSEGEGVDLQITIPPPKTPAQERREQLIREKAPRLANMPPDKRKKALDKYRQRANGKHPHQQAAVDARLFASGLESAVKVLVNQRLLARKLAIKRQRKRDKDRRAASGLPPLEERLGGHPAEIVIEAQPGIV